MKQRTISILRLLPPAPLSYVQSREHIRCPCRYHRRQPEPIFSGRDGATFVGSAPSGSIAIAQRSATLAQRSATLTQRSAAIAQTTGCLRRSTAFSDSYYRDPRSRKFWRVAANAKPSSHFKLDRFITACAFNAAIVRASIFAIVRALIFARGNQRTGNRRTICGGSFRL